MEEFPITLKKKSKTLVLELCKHKHTVISIIYKAKTLNLFSLLLKQPKFEKFLKKREMNLHVIVEKRNTKMLHTGSPNWPGPSLLRRLTASSSITDGRITLAAALAQAPSSFSFPASADRGGKTLKALC